MLSTAIYPALSADPAAFSREIASDELRARLGFKGVAITDALDSVAVRAFGGPAKAGVAAVRAGSDLLLFTDLPSTNRPGGRWWRSSTPAPSTAGSSRPRPSGCSICAVRWRHASQHGRQRGLTLGVRIVRGLASRLSMTAAASAAYERRISPCQTLAPAPLPSSTNGSSSTSTRTRSWPASCRRREVRRR